METPPADWPELIKDTDKASVWAELESELDAIAARAAMLAGYIGKRAGTDGCGKSTHQDAAKAANKRLVKVRMALGFTYPERGQISF